jgi:MinD superfamily P-loop ATPase
MIPIEKKMNLLSNLDEFTILMSAPAKKTNEVIMMEVPRIVESHCKTCGEVATSTTTSEKNQRAFLP